MPLNGKRKRPAKLVTLSPEAWTMLDSYAENTGQSRSAAIEQLVRSVCAPLKAARPARPLRAVGSK
jgi:hypothetical protein